MLIFYNLLINLIFKSKNTDLYKSLKFNINKKFYVLTTVLFTSVLLFTSSAGFKKVATDRGLSEINITINSVKEFLTLYYDLYFAQFSYFWIIFAILLICSYCFAYKKKELKKVVFPSLMLFSILIVIFSLILCGKTHNHHESYLLHENIRYNFLLLVLFPFLMCFGYFIKHIVLLIKNKKIKPLFFYSVIISILILSVKSCNYSITQINNNGRISDGFGQELYIFEKMARFYYLKNEIPKLPIETHKYELYRYENMFNKNYQNSKYTVFAKSYYPQIYKSNISEELGFIVSENALEEFEAAGGIFTEYELKHICFNRLLDDDFVLNKKTNLPELKNYLQ